MNISWASLGETGSTFFFRSAQAKRQKLWVRCLEVPDDTNSKTKKIIYETDKIQDYFFHYYEKLNTNPDPFSTVKFNDFFPTQLFEKINKLDSNDVKQKLNLPISIAELRKSISKLNKSSCGGPDGISSKLLEWFSIICPNLILKAINKQMFSGNSNGKAVNERTIIFIPKPADRLDIQKLDLYHC